MNLSEDDIICDLAETYHIYDYKQMPLYKVAIFVCGLKDDSRIMLKASNRTISLDRLINATICDNSSLLVWSQTEDGHKNRNRPKRFVEILLGQEKETDIKKFRSSEEFLKAWYNEE